MQTKIYDSCKIQPLMRERLAQQDWLPMCETTKKCHKFMDPALNLIGRMYHWYLRTDNLVKPQSDFPMQETQLGLIRWENLHINFTFPAGWISK